MDHRPPVVVRLVTRIVAALRGALIGTANLRETYRDDLGTCATLQQIEGQMTELVETHQHITQEGAAQSPSGAACTDEC